MTVLDGALDAADIMLLAQLHAQALPDSLVARIGSRYVRAFYRYLARSPHEIVLLDREPRGALRGACILSTEPQTLTRRLARHTPLVLLAPFALLRLPLRAMLMSPFRPVTSQVTQPPGPEILLIYTIASARSQGLGAVLLQRCQDLVARQGAKRLLVKTRDDPTNRALCFYERNGFTRRAVLINQGKRLALFEKALPEAAS